MYVLRERKGRGHSRLCGRQRKTATRQLAAALRHALARPPVVGAAWLHKPPGLPGVPGARCRFLASRAIPCSFDPPEGGRPLALQLERGDPRHGPAEAVGGTTGGAGGDTDGGGACWDLQLSRDPDSFPEGFRVSTAAHFRSVRALGELHQV